MGKLKTRADDGRSVAFEVLLRVNRGGAWAGLTLDAALRERPHMDYREKALATELVYGSLRLAPALDRELARHSRRPLANLDERVLILLRLGSYQLLHLRIPDHAAVAETVELAEQAGVSHAKGFLNAVLRALTRDPRPPPPPLDEDPCGNLLVEEGLPDWLCKLWLEDLPIREAAKLAKSSNQPARVHLRAASRRHRSEVLKRLEDCGVAARPDDLSPVGIRLEKGIHPENIPAWEDLGLQAQDEGAQLVTYYALLSGHGRPDCSNEVGNVLDACAAPGGKTCHLAQALPNARIVAVDLHRRRVERVRREAVRLGLAERVETHAADATGPMPFVRSRSFDLVLVDAPCTGLGTLRRHPEIKLRRSVEDVNRLANLQSSLLDALADAVAPGGLLVYAVCTMTRAEGPGVIQRFLTSHADFTLERPSVPAKSDKEAPGTSHEEPSGGSGSGAPWVDLSSIPWESLLTPEGELRLWTHRHGTDGFFAARLRRQSE